MQNMQNIQSMQCIEKFDTKSFVRTTDTYEDRTFVYDHCVWKRHEPSPVIFGFYMFVVPTLAVFGLCANFINAIVFMRPKMTPSAFSYLAALSWLDCASCLLIVFTALSRSIFFGSTFWLAYDFQWQTPLFGITTGAANLILACVSLDRLVYLWNGMPNGTPRFCRRKVARRMILGVLLISFLVNVPYFFVFVVNKDGTFQTTQFYFSTTYKIHNWFTFILLAVLPAIFLLIGNAAIIIAFRRWTKQSKRCQQHCSSNAKVMHKRYQHQMKLTITILIVITLYMIGELPAHLTSRKSALNLIFNGDISKVNIAAMEHLEIICITLNALQLSVNILVYALINPSFMPEFFICLRGASDACFRFFCCISLVHCCRRSCCQKANSEASPTYPRTCPKVESQMDSWGAEVSSNSQVLEAAAHAVAVEMRHTKFERKMQLDRSNCSSENSWKRSSSVGEFAFDNPTLELEKVECETDRRAKEQQKRHSVPN